MSSSLDSPNANNNKNAEYDVMDIDDEEPENNIGNKASVAADPPLVLSPDLQFPLGSRVRIHGLVHRPKINSHLAIVEEFLWDQGRYKIRPLGRSSKRLTKSKYLAVRGVHLQLVEPSSFLVRLTDRAGTTLRGAFYCNVISEQEQLVVQIMHQDDSSSSSNDKDNTIAPREELNRMSCHEDRNVFDILNTPIDYEYLTEDQFLDGDEVLILYPKPIICDLYEAMVDYELLEELDMTAYVGLHGSINLCRLRFPYRLPGLKEPPNYDKPANDEPLVGAEAPSANKRQKAVNDTPAPGATDVIKSADLVQENGCSASSGTKKRQLED